MSISFIFNDINFNNIVIIMVKMANFGSIYKENNIKPNPILKIIQNVMNYFQE